MFPAWETPEQFPARGTVKDGSVLVGRDFTKVGVVGLGTMGAGIVEVFARSGHEVIGVEVDDDAAARGRALVETSTARAVARGKLDDDARETLLGRISYATALDDLHDVELVIEAVPERLDLKQEIFGRLGKICRPDTVLATNTSSLSVTEISVASGRPDRVVGLHFFNPAPVMTLVEVVRTVVSDPDVVAQVEELVRQVGKTDVTIGDRAGFIANALLFGYLNHAVSLIEMGYVGREDVDAAMRFGCGLPMGPLSLLDLIGIDTAYEILDTMYKQTRDRLHAPQPLIKQMVTAGLLGRKSGRGFYTYRAPGSPETVADAQTPRGGADGELARPIRTVGVVGSGTMATGIAEVFAKGGYEVVYVTRAPEKSAKVRASIERSLEKAVQRGRLTDQARDETLGRLSGSTSLDELAEVDLVVEAIAEELSVKEALFANLDEICKPGAVLATTTSSLAVVDLAAQTARPEAVVGLHFFNPAPVMKLVEVVHTIRTAPDVVATAVAVCQRLGKYPVSCGDRAGFVVNRLLFPYLNDAVRMLEAHYASADDIDQAMVKGCGYPMGPFALLDVVGLDVSLAIQTQLYREFREPGFAPVPLLEHMVTAGRLGRKTGHGFRDHPAR
jgi:3-hydroxybutyryl-CoA dehydrogenase